MLVWLTVLPLSFPHLAHLGLVLDRQIQLELSWELILRVQPVREIHPSDATVGVDLRVKTKSQSIFHIQLWCHAATWILWLSSWKSISLSCFFESDRASAKCWSVPSALHLHPCLQV